jgi:hypothetical protein
MNKKTPFKELENFNYSEMGNKWGLENYKSLVVWWVWNSGFKEKK